MNPFNLPKTGYSVLDAKIIKKRKEFKVSDRREALRKANYMCQNPKCKERRLRKDLNKKFGYVVHFDHKDNNPSNNRASNIKVLCPTCHAQLTVLKKRKQWGVLGHKHQTIKVSKERLMKNKPIKKKIIKKKRRPINPLEIGFRW